MPLGRLRHGPDGRDRRCDRLSDAGLPASPYPGLASYGDDDAELFFGRSRECELVLANLRAARLTVLHGPGGAGKSSLLRAGVVHRLREDAQREAREDGEARTAVAIVDDWSGSPLARLTSEIVALAGGGEAPPDGEVPAGGVQDALLAAVDAYRARRRGSLLLVFDQFEEHLRLGPGAGADGLEEIVARLLGDPRPAVRILFAVRDDRLADFARFGARIPGLLNNVLRLGPLSRAAAVEAIERPVERYAELVRERGRGREVTLEPGLAEAVLDDLATVTPGGSVAGGDARRGMDGVDASFLQLVMRRLWDEDAAGAGRAQLRVETLKRLGGARAILASHLDSALDGLSAREQALADELLRYLVTPSGATAVLSVRDLSAYTARSPQEIEALVERLGRAPARILRGTGSESGDGGGYELAPLLAQPAMQWRAQRRVERVEARARRLVVALAAVSAAALALVAYLVKPSAFERLEAASVDERFELRGARGADPRLVLVTGDGSAIASPQRATFARALDAIAASRPSVLVVALVFLEQKDPSADLELRRAIRGPLAPRIVLATDRLDRRGETGLLGGAETLNSTDQPRAGYAGVPQERDNVVRRINRDVALDSAATPMDTLATSASRIATGRDLADLPDAAWIDYRGPAGTYPRVALSDVLRLDPAAMARLRGRVVVLGDALPGERMTLPTSAPGGGRMQATEIQANAIATALDGFPLRDGGRLLDGILIVLLALLPALVALRARPSLVCAVAVAVAALFCVAVQIGFDAGRVVTLTYPVAALVLATVAALLAVRRRPPPGRRPTRSA